MSSKSSPEQRLPPAAHGRRSGPWSLAARLTAWYAGSAFLLILLATSFLYWVLASNLDREDDEYLTDKVQFVRRLLKEKPDDSSALKQEVEFWAGQQAPFYMRILDETGKSMLETPGMSEQLPSNRFPAADLKTGEIGQVTEIVVPRGKTFRLVTAVAVQGRTGSRRVLEIAMDRSREEDLLARYRMNLWLVLSLSVVLCAVVGYRIARRGLRPLSEITETTRRVRSTTLDERIAVAGLPAELSVLARTFNEMLDRLEESFDRLTRFSADIAHELRTPVNNLRGEAEVALRNPRSAEEYREVLASSLEEAGRLSRLIDSLLFLARADSPETQIARERLDIGRELATVREFYEAAAVEARIQLSVAAERDIFVSVDRTLFQRAVGNLVANALAHTPAGGRVTLTAVPETNGVRIQVADNGVGIAPEHLPHVFDRFYRADQARSTGSGRVGLGLAIVRGIATLHHGSVSITSEVGQGTQVNLVFPRYGSV